MFFEGLLLLILGIITVVITHDATFTIIAILSAIGMFFSCDFEEVENYDDFGEEDT